MKKLLSLLLALSVILSLASCAFSLEFGEGPRAENAPNETPNVPETPADPENPEDPEDPEDPDSSWDSYETITVAEALELCGEPGNLTTERYYIRAVIASVDNASYGAMTIEDNTGSIYVYNTASSDGTVGYADMMDKPTKGDEVLLYCTLQNYNGTKEVKSAYLIDFKVVEEIIDESSYTEMSISEARAAEDGAKIKLDGVVARITYANGKIPNGVMLVDETASIYVYSSDVAQFVNVGNKITVIGEKDYWILDSEQSNAAKFGYKGANQLANAAVVDNDNGDNDFDTSWIAENTVKGIIDTPVTEDITTQIYKVVARVSKVPGNGFVNYYFNDLDYIDADNPGTGSYAYTMCNGSDFDWLDEFDGKVCTVYLTAINAKSTASESFFRFLPISVEAIDGFTFPEGDVAEHAVKYYGVDQFAGSYSGNPELQLTTTVSSAFLGFENATLTYSSSDTSVVSFTESNGSVILNCLEAGKATVTVTGSYSGTEYSDTVEITVIDPTAVSYVTVADAIASENGTVVTVKGIVGPSLVNQTGFFLIDESGAIPVRVDSATIEQLAIGYEVIMSGTRTVTKDGTGQICLDNAVLEVNNYGSHSYSTSSFITGKTLAEICRTEDTADATTDVYVVDVTVTTESDAYSTKIFVSDGINTLILYCSGASQYDWLAALEGQTITVELQLCDWNGKGLKGCVLSATSANGQVFNELNFSK